MLYMYIATVLIYTCLLHTVQAAIVEGPSSVKYIPGLTPLPIELICNCTGIVVWGINNTLYDLANGVQPGHNRTGNNLLVNTPVNNTKYFCVSISYFNVRGIYSDPAYIVIAGETLMYSCIYTDISVIYIHTIAFVHKHNVCSYACITYAKLST